MKRIKSRYKGMTRRCRCCPKYTPNLGGICTRCLDHNVPERSVKAIAPKGPSISKLVNEILKERDESYEPVAVSRGRGIRVP